MYEMDMHVSITCLYRAKDPKDQSLYNHQAGATYPDGEVHTDILADIRISALFAILIGPLLKPKVAS